METDSKDAAKALVDSAKSSVKTPTFALAASAVVLWKSQYRCVGGFGILFTILLYCLTMKLCLERGRLDVLSYLDASSAILLLLTTTLG